MEAGKTLVRNRTRILGIDPGLWVTGYAVLDGSGQRPRLSEAGVVRTKAAKAFGERLQEISVGIEELLVKYRPSAIALEQLFSASRHPRAGLQMAHARGVICLAAVRAGVPVVEYTATRIKKLLTGSGRASKDQMQRAVQMQLELARLPEPADVADALALALCHWQVSTHLSTEWFPITEHGGHDLQDHRATDTGG